MTAAFEDEGDDGAGAEGDVLVFTVPSGSEGQRLDKALAGLAEELSRSQVKALVLAGNLKIDGVPCADVSFAVRAGMRLELVCPPPEASSVEPEDIPLAIVFEDEHLLVINKPAGLVVHPGAGNWRHTLVNALLFHCGDQLSGIGGVVRPGIVHRLDKDTSGLMVAAKTDKAHKGLAAQLEDRSLSRTYFALVLGVPVPAIGDVELAIGRHRTNRQKMAVVSSGGRHAHTHYRVREQIAGEFALVECALRTGRTHQIRVHMAAIKHPLVGDPLYGPQRTALKAALNRAKFDAVRCERFLGFPRQALHAAKIGFVHPVTGEDLAFEVPPPDDMAALLDVV